MPGRTHTRTPRFALSRSGSKAGAGAAHPRADGPRPAAAGRRPAGRSKCVPCRTERGGRRAWRHTPRPWPPPGAPAPVGAGRGRPGEEERWGEECAARARQPEREAGTMAVAALSPPPSPLCTHTRTHTCGVHWPSFSCSRSSSPNALLCMGVAPRAAHASNTARQTCGGSRGGPGVLFSCLHLHPPTHADSHMQQPGADQSRGGPCTRLRREGLWVQLGRRAQRDLQGQVEASVEGLLQGRVLAVVQPAHHLRAGRGTRVRREARARQERDESGQRAPRGEPPAPRRRAPSSPAAAARRARGPAPCAPAPAPGSAQGRRRAAAARAGTPGPRRRRGTRRTWWPGGRPAPPARQ